MPTQTGKWTHRQTNRQIDRQAEIERGKWGKEMEDRGWIEKFPLAFFDFWEFSIPYSYWKIMFYYLLNIKTLISLIVSISCMGKKRKYYGIRTKQLSKTPMKNI